MVKKEFVINIIASLLVVVLLILVRLFVVEPLRIHTDNMAPVLPAKRQVLVFKHQPLENLDLVAYQHDGKKYVGRIIGLPNQTVSSLDDILYLDGKVIKEPYIASNKSNYQEAPDENYTSDFNSGTLKAKHYWVLNDMRQVKEDSRIFGSIDERDILGKIAFIYQPFSEFGFVENDAAKLENGFD